MSALSCNNSIFITQWARKSFFHHLEYLNYLPVNLGHQRKGMEGGSRANATNKSVLGSIILSALFLFVFTHRVWLLATLSTIALQTPLSMEFSRQEYWSELPFPPPGYIPDPGIELASPMSPALQVDSLPLSYWRSHMYFVCVCVFVCVDLHVCLISCRKIIALLVGILTLETNVIILRSLTNWEHHAMRKLKSHRKITCMYLGWQKTAVINHQTWEWGSF